MKNKNTLRALQSIRAKMATYFELELAKVRHAPFASWELASACMNYEKAADNLTRLQNSMQIAATSAEASFIIML